MTSSLSHVVGIRVTARGIMEQNRMFQTQVIGANAANLLIELALIGRASVICRFCLPDVSIFEKPIIPYIKLAGNEYI